MIKYLYIAARNYIHTIISFLKTHYKPLIFFLCFSSFNIFLLCHDFVSHSLPFDATFMFMLIGSILLESLLYGILYVAQKHQWKIEKIFLVFALVIGSVFVLAMPTGRAPDEASHFYRIYEILEGHIVSEIDVDGQTIGSNEPSNIMIVEKFAANNNTTYEDILNHLNDSKNNEQKFMSTSAQGYSPISYTPQLIGMGIGKVLNLPFLFSTYIAKFSNLFFCVLILYFCIKKIPILKNIIFLLAFLPISMQSMCSLSADGVIFVSAVALICFILYSIYSRKTPFTKRHFFATLILCTLITTSKIAYLPLCLLLFAIPKERFGDIRKKLFWISGISIATIAIYIIWYLVTPPLVSITDSTAQISFIIHNPLNYLSIIIHTIASSSINETLFFFSGAFGGYLEWLNITPSLVYIIAIYTVFVLLCQKASQSAHTTKGLKLLSIFTLLTTVIAIFTAMFVTWTGVGEAVIRGVQGRYFLPLLLLIPICFLSVSKTKNQKPSIKKIPQNYYLYAFIIFECVYTISTIACAHL